MWSEQVDAFAESHRVVHDVSSGGVKGGPGPLFTPPYNTSSVSAVASGFQPTDELEQFNQRENMLLEAGNLDEATELNLRMWVDGPQRSAKAVDASIRRRVAEMQLQIFSQPFPENVSLGRIEPPASDRLAEIQTPVLIVSGAPGCFYIWSARKHARRSSSWRYQSGRSGRGSHGQHGSPRDVQ